MNRIPFHELLLQLEQAEDDPEKSKAVLEQLAERIDEIKEHQDNLTAEAEGFRIRAAKISELSVVPLLSRAQALENEAARILTRIQEHMLSRGFEKLPGQFWRLDLRPKSSVEIKVEANAENFLKFEGFVKRKVEYSWDKNLLKTALKMKPIPGLDAKLKHEKYLKFEVAKK